MLDLTAFDSARLLIVGDIMLDRYWYGPTSRISPEAPVPVVRVDESEDRPGGAANVALNIASLGANVCLSGLVGRDDNADRLASALTQAGITTHFHVSDAVPTITKLRVMSRNQQLIRLDFESPASAEDAAPLADRVAEALPESDLMILSDYGKGSLSNIEQLIALGRKLGKRVLIDPKGSDYSRYKGASIITPNLSEFEAVVGPCTDDDDMITKGERLRKELGLEALLITLSERGMMLIRANEAPLHLPTHAQAVYDVTGAGDTVIGVLGLALAAGQPLPTAMWLANLAAGVVVAKAGTATLTVAELHEAIQDAGQSSTNDSSLDAVIRQVRAAQAHGERVVMTNGCFDILHSGHVGYLEEARQLGDRLLIAVNDDASVARLKGPTRPVNTLDRRMRVLGALASVDWVVPFSEDTPQALIEQVLPDVLVKGGDYKIEEIAGHEAVLANGGDVKVLGFEEGVSTSALIKAIQGQTP